MLLPTVKCQHTNSASNSTRLTTLTYPDGRGLDYAYGSSGSVNDAASRVAAIFDGAPPVANYEYLGLGTVARVDYP